IASFAVKLNKNDELEDYFPITGRRQIKDGYNALVFTVEEQAKGDFYNGYTYLDTLNPQATTEYIRQTHERYRASCGDMFGREIIGIFTDEPHRGCIFGGFGLANKNADELIPYTPGLFEAFKRRFKYELLPRLPEIYYFREGADFSKISYDYTEILQEMFIDNFAKPYYDWCKKNKLIVTGHILHEDTLSSQASVSGSVQRYYEYMDYPGVDILTEGNKNFWVIKQVYSVAKQLKKPFVLSELYGCTGWQMSFESHKTVGDWQASLGVNLRCHHLSWYTMQGEAKRDFPGSIFHQSAWYERYKYVEDYFARIGYILSLGEPVTDTLVINPIESVWGKIRKGCFTALYSNAVDITEIEKDYFSLFKELSDNGIDFDYADEELLSRYYKIKDGRLYVGACGYSTVVVSGLVTIRKSTLDILAKFIESGGRAVIKDPPRYVNGDAAEIDFKAYKRVETFGEIVDACRESSMVKQNKFEDVITHIRECDGDYFAVLVNTNRIKEISAAEITFCIPGGSAYFAEELDLRSGETKGCRFESGDKGVTIKTHFAKGGERAFRLTRDRVKPFYASPAVRRIVVPDALKYELSEDNVLVLDIAGCLVDGRDIGTDEILKIDRKVREIAGLPFRGGEMVQPWYREKHFEQKSPQPGCELVLKYVFDIESVPDRLCLCLETPGLFGIDLNGSEVRKEIIGNYIDNSIYRILLPHSALKPGLNELTLSCRYHEGAGLEAVYLTGQFGVRLGSGAAAPKIIGLPPVLDARPLCEQGLPFYGGVIRFFTGIKTGNVSLRFPRIRGAYYEADFGGGSTKIAAFPPYETKFQSIKGELTFVLCLTRRNTFGPLHLAEAHQFAYGPGSFLTEGKDFTLSHNLIDEGMDVPEILCRV
ncbi:MAG: hypothetical protein WC958_06230, partial [Dehalococcoidales bacterium]